MSAALQSPASLAWVRSLRQPDITLHWSIGEWQRVIRLARRLRLLGRLAESLDANGLTSRLAPQVQRHLQAELRLSRARLRVLKWTVDQLGLMLSDADHPIVLLKGAAYLSQALPIAPGRLPSDLDILVPRERLADVQQRLQAHGWWEIGLDEHDRRYYHEWSHEVPPMHHERFGIELDLHHNILPPIARMQVDDKLLLQRLQPSEWGRWMVLCPVDQVLHSAAHLFLDSELRDRLRDLVDLDGLTRHFAAHPEFWSDLMERSRQLGLTEPLMLALHFLRHWLGSPVPEAMWRPAMDSSRSTTHQALLLALFERVLLPTEPDVRPTVSQGLAATTLLARYHLHRMPLRLLLPHLWHKARNRSLAEREGEPMP
jgi:Uncharacterised nucleotidyltransferase